MDFILDEVVCNRKTVKLAGFNAILVEKACFHLIREKEKGNSVKVTHESPIPDTTREDTTRH